MENYNRPPFWYIVVIMLMAVPLFFWPFLMEGGLLQIDGMSHDDESFLVTKQFFSIGFPIFAVLTLYIAYRTYAERRSLSIVLLVILALSYLALPFVL